MLERSPNNKLKIIRQLLISILFSIQFSATPLKAFEPDELSFESNPYVIKKELAKHSGPGKDAYESLVISLNISGKWYSVGAKGGDNSVGIGSSVEIERKFNEKMPEVENLIQEEVGSTKIKMVFTHNHSAEVIFNQSHSIGVDNSLISKKDKLLSGPGPGEGDCVDDDNGKGVSVVVEPGGTWICKTKESGAQSVENLDRYTQARRELILGSQGREEKLSDTIQDFIKKAKKYMGFDMVFIPNDTSEEEFMRILEKMLD
jgi:hypothetical protein